MCKSQRLGKIAISRVRSLCVKVFVCKSFCVWKVQRCAKVGTSEPRRFTAIYVFTPSHLQIYIFTPSHLQIYFLAPSHLLIYVLAPSHLQIYIFTPSHLLIYFLAPSHLLISLYFSLSLFLSLRLSVSPSLSLSLSLPPHLCLSVVARHVSYDALYQAAQSQCICMGCHILVTFHNLSLHSSYKIHLPFTDYFLRLPLSELFEKRFSRSRANRRIVSDKHWIGVFQLPYLITGDYTKNSPSKNSWIWWSRWSRGQNLFPNVLRLGIWDAHWTKLLAIGLGKGAKVHTALKLRRFGQCFFCWGHLAHNFGIVISRLCIPVATGQIKWSSGQWVEQRNNLLLDDYRLIFYHVCS